MYEELQKLVDFIHSLDWIWHKDMLIEKVVERFFLIQDRKVFYCSNFSIRFSYSWSGWFSNTILSLSNLKKYDDKPFIVCLTTKEKNILFIANSTFLKKISHSSKELRSNNIKWSFNWSDILREYAWYKNEPKKFKFLFEIHKEIGFEENLPRLVESTNNIAPIGQKFDINGLNKDIILHSPVRATSFVKSSEFFQLKTELDSKVEKYINEILIAAFIDNVNIRWRIIEYLIAWEDLRLKSELIYALNNKNGNIPKLDTHNWLWDYQKIFESYRTETDIKTKIMILNSNPKAYNIDKFLQFMAEEKSIFMFYFIWVEPNKILNQALISVFQTDLIKWTLIQNHWASRNSRWVAQFNWWTIEKLILNENNQINIEESVIFLKGLINR